jgi:hypothetical protein
LICTSGNMPHIHPAVAARAPLLPSSCFACNMSPCCFPGRILIELFKHAHCAVPLLPLLLPPSSQVVLYANCNVEYRLLHVDSILTPCPPIFQSSRWILVLDTCRIAHRQRKISCKCIAVSMLLELTWCEVSRQSVIGSQSSPESWTFSGDFETVLSQGDSRFCIYLFFDLYTLKLEYLPFSGN